MLGGCQLRRYPASPKVETSNLPATGHECVAEVGTPVLSRVEVAQYDALILKNRIYVSLSYRDTLVLPPGRLSAQIEDEQWLYFIPEKGLELHTRSEVIKGVEGGLMIHKERKKWPRIFLCENFRSKPAEVKPDFEIVKDEKMRLLKTSQELIFKGRANDKVVLTYREDLVGSVKEENIELPLGEIEVRGARLRLIESSDRKLRYEVLQPFPLVPIIPEIEKIPGPTHPQDI